ncbi:unnamed protein product [Dicrocoelium dendriticum]|nr:unnamed protein product [Dicrocoelium dendriticum]
MPLRIFRLQRNKAPVIVCVAISLLFVYICSLRSFFLVLIVDDIVDKKPSEKTLRQLERAIVPPNGQLTCQAICRNVPPVSERMEQNLAQVGDVKVRVELESSESTHIRHISPTLQGGAWAYRSHAANSSWHCERSYDAGVAIVIGCKNRWEQLNVMLHYLIPLLQKQRLCFRIFVVEQLNPSLYNRGAIFNVGFLEAAKHFRFRCVIFHDVDLAPINDLNPYGCDSLTENIVVHLGVGLDNRSFKLNYPSLVGGVLKFSTPNFIRVNGFSNRYWGWGQEDDDMGARILVRGLHYIHVPISVARYHAIPHDPAPKDRVVDHLPLLKSAKARISTDGLNSLNYSIVDVKHTLYYTHISVDVDRSS